MGKPRTLKTASLRQRKALCGPACLKIVADYFNCPASAARLAELCRSSTVSGTTGANLVRGAHALGLCAEIVDHAEFAMIERWIGRGVPVIVDWMSVNNKRAALRIAEGHYSVVCGLTRSSIVLEDPAIGGRRRMPKLLFRRVWFDFTHLHPRTHGDLIIRRMIVVAPRDRMEARSPKAGSRANLNVHSKAHTRSPRRAGPGFRRSAAYAPAGHRRGAKAPGSPNTTTAEPPNLKTDFSASRSNN